MLFRFILTAIHCEIVIHMISHASYIHPPHLRLDYIAHGIALPEGGTIPVMHTIYSQAFRQSGRQRHGHRALT